MTAAKPVGVRLAIRREGMTVNAYLAETGTMQGAKFLASLDADVAGDKAIFERWKELLSGIVSRAVEETFGEMPEMVEQKAPEHERAGRG